jgi:hypothetical protein
VCAHGIIASLRRSGKTTLGWGEGGVLTSWRPHPWFYVDNTCRSDLEDAWRSLCAKNNIRNQEVVHQVKEFTRPLPVQHRKKTCRRWRALSVWIGLGRPWSTHYLPKKKLMKDPHTKSLCPFFAHQVHAWAWRKNLGHLAAKIFLRQFAKFGEDHTSLPAFCRREKPEPLRIFNEDETEIPMELRWFQHDMEMIKSSFWLTAKCKPCT